MAFQIGDDVGFKRGTEKYGKVVGKSTKKGYLELKIETDDDNGETITITEPADRCWEE